MQQYWGIWSDIALVLFGVSAVIFAAGWWWTRAKELQRDSDAIKSRSADDTGLLDRLTRIEQIVETSAIELERIAEGQRFTSKILAERVVSAHSDRAPERIITPH